MQNSVTQHIELTRAIDAWVQGLRSGDEDFAAQVSVDLADLLHAAGAVRTELQKLLSADLADPSSADDALQSAANIEVQLFTELKEHLESLAVLWPRVQDALQHSTERAK
ncbi:MAG TPA: hypothetical protein VF761_14530 [Gemmatimonadaceae bacterium]